MFKDRTGVGKREFGDSDLWIRIPVAVGAASRERQALHPPVPGVRSGPGMVTWWPRAVHAGPGVLEPSPGCQREEALRNRLGKGVLEAAEATLPVETRRHEAWWCLPPSRSSPGAEEVKAAFAPLPLSSAPFPSPFSKQRQVKA